jgi:putative effector of murein hydrolase
MIVGIIVLLAFQLAGEIPLYKKLSLIPMLAALLVGSLIAVGSTVLLCRGSGFEPTIMASLAPKSTTAAVAMAISSGLHGDAALTAAVVILTGICGAIIVTPPLMNAMRHSRLWRPWVHGGSGSHGIGTARAYSLDPVAGLFRHCDGT